MNKQEFLEFLGKKLNGLSKDELNDILFEYSTHIDNKVIEGMTEKEAIKEFGDIDILVSEILNAYEVNENFKSESFKNKTKYYLDRISEFITALTDSVSQITKKDFKNILSKGLILIILLFVVQIPFSIIGSTIYSISRIFPDFISGAIYAIFAGLFNLIYFTICAYALYLFLNKEILRNKIEEEKMETRYTENIGKDISTDVIRAKKVKTKKNNDMNVFFANILNIVLKVIVLLIITPLLIGTIILIIATGLTISLTFIGYPLIGISMLLIGISVSMFSVIIPGMKFIFNWGHKNEKVFN